jgi:cysteine desulfurase
LHDRAEVRLNGHPEKWLPNTLSLSFLGVDSLQLLALLDGEVALSGGSACHSGGVNTSPVLAAMGVAPEWAAGAVRFSAGRMTTPDEIMTTVDSVVRAVETCRRAPSSGAAQ